MKIQIKTIDTENGTVYFRKNGRRMVLGESDVCIDVYEVVKEIEIVKGTKTKVIDYGLCLIVCKDNQFKLNVEQLEEMDGFDITADIQRLDGNYKRLNFNNVVPRTININGDWVFDISNSHEIIKELKKEQFLSYNS